MADKVLMPCPFCGGNDIHIDIIRDSNGEEIGSQIVCYECLAVFRQAEACSDEEQIREWNRRAKDTSPNNCISKKSVIRYLDECRPLLTDWRNDNIEGLSLQEIRYNAASNVYDEIREMIESCGSSMYGDKSKESDNEKPSKPCHYCDGELRLLAGTYDTKLYLNTKRGSRSILIDCMPCPEKAICCFHNTPARMVMAIAFCPMCGRKL